MSNIASNLKEISTPGWIHTVIKLTKNKSETIKIFYGDGEILFG